MVTRRTQRRLLSRPLRALGVLCGKVFSFAESDDAGIPLLSATDHRRCGAVAANHPLAAQAGLLALRAGGNAVDAAVATSLALAVVEPMMSGLGGDGFYHVYEQATGRAVVFNGTGPAPAAATPERYAGGIPRIGPLSVSVPGTPAGLDAM